jgi:hypothetical protein
LKEAQSMNYPCNLRGLAAPILIACFGLSGGCVEPNYRADVRPTGQGGVEVYRIPKDDPVPAPAPAVTQTPQAVDDRIEELEKQVRAQNAEIQKLKQEKAAAPTTAQ